MGGLAHAQTPSPWTSADATPSFRILKGSPLAPSAAWSASTTATDGLCRDYGANTQICQSGSRPRAPELKALARALKNDPNLIYEYVRNRIDTEFMFGSHKGALGASIDLSGTAFDQASLLVELLREAGFTARYRYGDITLDQSQFRAWTSVSGAQAACELLAAGGIPASVNGSSASCVLTGAVSTVTLAHVWVEADMAGGAWQFDPSYKPYQHKAGIDPLQVMSLQQSGIVAAANGTVSRSGDGKEAAGFSNGGLAGHMEIYAGRMRGRLVQGDLSGAALSDVIGGRVMIAAERPAGGWKQSALPYPASARGSWTQIPDAYRTTLGLAGRYPSGASPLSATLFTDEIYGRTLAISARVVTPYGVAPVVVLDGVAILSTTPIAAAGVVSAQDEGVSYRLNLNINHPFQAEGGVYGDTTIGRRIDFSTGPVAIVYALGQTSPRLGAKWAQEDGGGVPYLDANGKALVYGESPDGGVDSNDRDSNRISAEWLAQYSTASYIHGQIGDARITNLHTLGVVFNIANVAPWSATGDLVDHAATLDFETATTVTSLNTSNAAPRAAVIRALAATAATLEGAVPEQVQDTPDSASTARRFTWANAPDSVSQTGARYIPGTTMGEDPEFVTRAAIPFQRVASGDGAPATSSFTPSTWYWPQFDTRPVLSSALKAYHDKGFDIITSKDVLLGPGSPSGTYSICQGCPGFYDTPSTQRGGAFVATRYDAEGAPVEIAHIVTNFYTASKGGGAAKPTEVAQEMAERLKDRFVDRSISQGVDVKTGKASFEPKVVSSVGQGEFPYKLEESFEVRSGLSPLALKSSVVSNLNRINSGLVSNFDGAVEFSSSGGELMGATRADAAAPTIAAFAAMQSVALEATAIDRDVITLMIADWWSRKSLRNVVTLHQGGSAAQYVETGVVAGERVYAAGVGASRVYVAGTPSLFRRVHLPTSEGAETTVEQRRTVLMDEMSVREVAANGDQRLYQHWLWGGSRFSSNDDPFFQGFRLKTWQFARGVSLTMSYRADSQKAAFIGASGNPIAYTVPMAIPLLVSSNFGRTLFLANGPYDRQIGALKSLDRDAADDAQFCRPLANYYLYATTGVHIRDYADLSYTDLGGGRWKVRFGKPQMRTISQRPIDDCALMEVYSPGDAAVPNVKYAYDGMGRVSQVQDALAIRTPAARGVYGFFIADDYRGERVDPTGAGYAVESLPAGGLSVGGVAAAKQTRTIDELQRVVVSLADGRGRVLQRTYPEGDVDRFKYDPRDNTIGLEKIGKPGSTEYANPLVVSAEYDAVWNKPLWIKDARGAQTDFTYVVSGDGAGQIKTTVQPAVDGGRPTWTFTYGAKGLPADVIDPTGMVTHSVYDAGKSYVLKSSTVDYGTGRLNLTTCYQTDASGNVQRQTDPRAGAGACP